MIRATITGDAELRAKLKRLQGNVNGQQMATALAAGGMLIVNTAKTKAPVITGTLRSSIHVGGYTQLSDDFGHNPRGADYSDLGGKTVTRSGASVQVGTNIEYGPPVEFGTGRRSAKPFLRPAYDEEKNNAVQEVADTLRELVEP